MPCSHIHVCTFAQNNFQQRLSSRSIRESSVHFHLSAKTTIKSVANSCLIMYIIRRHKLYYYFIAKLYLPYTCYTLLQTIKSLCKYRTKMHFRKTRIYLNYSSPWFADIVYCSVASFSCPSSSRWDTHPDRDCSLSDCYYCQSASRVVQTH